MSDSITTIGDPTAPNAGETAVIFDTTGDPGIERSLTNTLVRRRAYHIDRLVVTVKSDVDLTYEVYEITGSETTWPVTPVYTEVIAAGTYYKKDLPVAGDDWKAQLVCVAPPNTFAVSVALIRGDRAATA